MTDCVFTSQGWKCEGEEGKSPGFPQRSSDSDSPLHLPFASLCKCHGEFLPRAGAALQSCISARGGGSSTAKHIKSATSSVSTSR